MAAGVDDALLRASLARGARGLVLEATGLRQRPARGAARHHARRWPARVPVVLVSRCAEGRVSPAYGYEGGGQMLRELGVIFGPDLPGPKARIKLMVALGMSSDPAEVRRVFEGDGPP